MFRILSRPSRLLFGWCGRGSTGAMNRIGARKAWGWAIVVAALVLGLTLAWLVTDELIDRQRSDAQDHLAGGMEIEARRQASVSAELAVELKSATDRSLLRMYRNRRLGCLGVLATFLLVVAGKRYRELGEQRLPSREELIQIPRGAGAGLSSARFSGAKEGADAAPTDLDPAFVDELLAREGKGSEAAIPILQAIQKHFRYLPDEILRQVCERSDITPAQIAGSATFYAQFRSSPVGRHMVRLCHGTACHVAGVGQIADEIRRRLSMDKDEDTDKEMRFTLDPVACLGCCSLAPVMMVGDETAGHLTPSSAWEALSTLEEPS